MLRSDRLCIWIFMFGFIFIIPSYRFVGFIDEICAFLFLSVAILDCVVNNNWHRYKPLWMAMCIMTAYAIYSIIFLSYNTTAYILMDWIIELKPYLPFLVLSSIAPSLNVQDRYILRKTALFNASLTALFSSCGGTVLSATLDQPYVAGVIIYVSVIVFILCSLDSRLRLPRRDLITAVILLTLGLSCGRSKYYGMYVITLASLLLYRPGIAKHFSIKHIVAVSTVILLVLIVSWRKIEYYFITGSSDTFDPTVAQSFARPVLFATGGMILIDHFPFGSGLASFATYPSQANYSSLYFEYGINKIHGLSPTMPDFICDAFLPSLAQFGIVGFLIFIWFWTYAYKFLRILIRNSPDKYKTTFVLGCLCICFILIESLGGNTFTQPAGILSMCVLGIICGKGNTIQQSQHDSNARTDNNLRSSSLLKI